MEKGEQIIIISGMPVNEFFERFDARTAALVKLLGNMEPKRKESDSYLTRKETAALLKISLPTLNEWTKTGRLISHRIGTRILYKTDEIKGAIGKRNFTELNTKGGLRAS